MRTLEVVILDVFSYFRLSFFKRRQRHLRQALLVKVAPERLYLPARLRVVGPAADMTDSQLGQHRSEFAVPAPTVILPPVVAQHFFRHPAFLYGRTEYFLHIVTLLEPV